MRRPKQHLTEQEKEFALYLLADATADELSAHFAISEQAVDILHDRIMEKTRAFGCCAELRAALYQAGVPVLDIPPPTRQEDYRQ